MTRADGERRPRLLLVHGWGMHPGCWGGLEEALEAVFDVRTLALPGHGGAPARPGWTVDSLGSAWARRWPGAYWLGWSLGAQVALAAAVAEPSAVARLVLLGGTPRFLAGAAEEDDWPCAMPRSSFESFRAACAADPKEALQRFLGLQVHGDADARTTLRNLRAAWRTAPVPDAGALLDGLAALEACDLREALTTVDTPMLWITGSRDRVAPLDAARRGAGKAPRGRVSCLPGAAHAPMFSHRQQLIALVRDELLDNAP